MLISKTIDAAMRKIGVLTAQDEASPADHQLGLETLNRIIDSYNTQNLTITYLEDIPYLVDYSVRPWSNSVTIGIGLEIDEVAPVQIEDLYFSQGGTTYKAIPMAYNQYADILTKSNIGIPRRYYVQRMNDNAIKIYFDFIPEDGLTLHLMAKRPYTGVNGEGNEYLPTDDIKWNFGFEKMLMYRLAVELSPDFEVQLSQTIIGLATEAEKNVFEHNYQPTTLSSDVSLNGNVSYRRRSF
jgi:hypothetical protein